jgi:LacI family transcriptional regulator
MTVDLSLNHKPPTKRRERATLADVAHLANVSAMAVSSVLNGARSSTRVAQATRMRIEAAAARLGYQPNAVARSLAKKRTNIIGLYTGMGSLTADTLFGAAILAGLQKGCAEIGRDLLLHGRFSDNNRWSVGYGDLSDGRLDGMLLLANLATPLIAQLTGSALPLVAMVDAIPGVPSVIADEEQGATMLVEHLSARGCTRIVWRGSDDQPADSTQRRLRGITSACTAMGLDLVMGDRGIAPRPFTARERALLDQPRSGKTAVVCFADYVCDALVVDAEQSGRSVPNDLAIAGFDGVAMVHAPRPLRRVTTVRCGWIQVAWKAVLALDQCIAGQPLAKELRLPVRLEIGDTT